MMAATLAMVPGDYGRGGGEAGRCVPVFRPLGRWRIPRR